MINIKDSKVGDRCKMEGYRKYMIAKNIKDCIQTFNVYQYRDGLYYVKRVYFDILKRNIYQIDMDRLLANRKARIPIQIINNTKKFVSLITREIDVVIKNVETIKLMKNYRILINVNDSTKNIGYIKDINIPDGMRYIGYNRIIFKVY
ncbi:hypothetical protein [Candidatus Vidania fulgoroideorum]